MFKIENGREHFYQWDLNQRIIVEDATITEVHFCNKTDDCSLVVETYLEADEVYIYDKKRYANVPNILLQNDWDIRVYAYCKDHTKHEERYKVKSRSKPADYVYTETEVKRWEALEASINAAIEEFSANEAERKQAETARAQAEDERNANFNKLVNEVDKTKQEMADTMGAISSEAGMTMAYAYEAAESANSAANRANTAAETLESANKLFSNALIGSTTGAAVRIDDASPIEHDMAVRVRGKNLVDADAVLTGLGWVKQEDGSYYGVNKKPTIIFENTAQAEGAFTVQYEAKCNESDVAATPLTFRVNYTDGTNAYVGSFPAANCTGEYFYKSQSTDSSKIVNYIQLSYGEYGNAVYIRNLQIEQGATATEYTPYVDVSAVKVQRYGKNLIPYPFIETSITKNGITFTDNGDSGITIKGTCTKPYATGFNITRKLPLIAGVTYAIKNDYRDIGVHVYLVYKDADAENPSASKTCGTSLLWKSSYTFDRVYLQINTSNAIEAVVYPQIELDEITEYEPYKEPVEYPVNADGSVDGLKPLQPTTTLLTDTTDTIIDVEYNRDINKAFAELYNAIISLGGNV